MAFKYYSALQASDGDQTLPIPMTLHNNNAATVSLQITPEGGGLIYQPFGTTPDVLSSIVTLPTLIAAQSVTTYPTTTDGAGSGATIAITTTNVGDGAFAAFPGSSALAGTAPISASTTYTPTGGTGTGFEVTLTQLTIGTFNPTSVVIVNAGSGYTIGDVLTFTVEGDDVTATLTVDVFTAMYQPSVAAIVASGDNYRAGDILNVVMEETVLTVDYEYPVEFNVEAADLVSTYITYSLPADQTTPMRASIFLVEGAVDFSILANSN
tara:strand:- start:1265 stop:2065 length:801 start_codon:yes stop_codon:yes gene_type:complete